MPDMNTPDLLTDAGRLIAFRALEVLKAAGAVRLTGADVLELARTAQGSIRIVLTMEVVEALLSLNTRNRGLKGYYADRLAEAMREGRWKDTGEPIIVSSQPSLNEGQHRLTALMLAGLETTAYVTFGVDPAAMDVTGTGKSRRAGDVLSIAGMVNGNRLAAACTVLIHYSRVAEARAWGSTPEHDVILRVAELVAQPEGKHGLSDSCRVLDSGMEGSGRFKPGSNSFGIVTHYLSTLHDPAKALAFWRIVHIGSADMSCPARSLRERLLADRDASRKLPSIDKFALMLKAWLAFQAGKPLRQAHLRWADNEAFPVVPGVQIPKVEG